MANVLALLLWLPIPATDVLLSENGIGSQYTEMPTIGTVQYRLEIGDLSMADLDWAEVYIAVPQCWRIGERGYIKIEDNHWLRYIVFDCASRDPRDRTRQWMEENNVLVEIDYWTVRRLDLVCRCGLEIEMVKDEFKTSDHRVKLLRVHPNPSSIRMDKIHYQIPVE